MKFDLLFDPPWMNAAGSLGFAPDAHGPVELSRLGAFVTNPVSLERRTPAQGTRFASYPGGFLLHTGHPNPGLKSVLKRNAAGWRRAALPVIVHLLAQHAGEVERMLRQIEALDGAAGVEIGLPPEVSTAEAAAMARAAAGELPVIVRLPSERAVELAQAIRAAAGSAAEGGITAFSLAAPRGALPVDGGVRSGRLYGPAVLPLALAAVQALVKLDLPVIGAGGVYSPADGQAMLDAGAAAVQVDAVLWRGGF